MTFYRRHLPHWQLPGQDLFITWRLFGSLPDQVRAGKADESVGRKFVRYDRVLDAAGTGPVWLKDPAAAEAVLTTLAQAHSRKLFCLRAYVLMANHVHVLIEPLAGLPEITHQVKGASARRANLALLRTGKRFWQDESFDHWVRNPAEGEKIRAYIERNPVAAGLVARAQDWPWSSASRPVANL